MFLPGVSHVIGPVVERAGTCPGVSWAGCMHAASLMVTGKMFWCLRTQLGSTLESFLQMASQLWYHRASENQNFYIYIYFNKV